MPKISKIRIVGLRYEKMKKQYDDLTFDFQNDEVEATNALISLDNGGGKGALLQTIFQIIKPGTSWGKEENRLYQHFFFGENSKFIPYHFHVAIDWQLDGDQNRNLITGGIFSAEKRTSRGEDENDYEIKPVFSFYSKEYSAEEPIIIENIPLTQDNKTRNAEELKDYFAENGYDAYRDRKKHYQILETNRINRKDWEIIKDINKDEGGVGKYFEGSEDDHNLFKKKIIPIASQVINKTEYEENDLVEIFRSQASIAKDLPILLQREYSHKEFLEIIQPFEEIVQKGIEQEKMFARQQQKGQQYLSALHHIVNTERKALEELTQDVAQIKTEIEDLHYQKDNVEYLKHYKQHEALLQEKEKKEEQKNTLENQIQEKQKVSNEIHLQIALKEWSEVNKQVEALKTQISALEQSPEAEEINEHLAQIQRTLIVEWKKTEDALKRETLHYLGYMNHLTLQESEMREKQKASNNRIISLNEKLNQLTDTIQQYQGKEQEFLQCFGKKIQYDVESVLKEQNKALKKVILEHEKAKKELHNVEEERREQSAKMGSLKATEVNTIEKINDYQQKMQKQKQKELVLAQALYTQFSEEIDIINPSILQKYANLLDQQLLQNEQDLERSHRLLWETQLNHSLNDGDMWIANQDLKTVKEQLDGKIHVFYGTEYLQSLSNEEKMPLLQSQPLLPFGLVVSQKEWHAFDKQSLVNKTFQSPIPIFIREKMSGDPSYAYDLLHGEETEFLFNQENYTKWKATFEKEIQNHLSVIEEQRKTKTYLEDLKEQVTILQSNTLAIEIQKAMEIEEEMLRNIQQQRQLLENLEAKNRERQTVLTETIASQSNEIANKKSDIALLETFQGEQTLYQKHVKEKEEKTEIIQELIKTNALEEQELTKKKEEIDLWKASYIRWENAFETRIKHFVPFVPNAIFPKAKTSDANETSPVLSNDLFDDIENLLEKYRFLQQSKDQQNMELVKKEEQLKYEIEKRVTKEKELSVFEPEWANVTITQEKTETLQFQLKNLQQEEADSIQESRAIELGIAQLTTKTQYESESMAKAEKNVLKHGRTVQIWEDIDLTMKEIVIEEELTLCWSEQKAADELSEAVKEKLRQYESNQQRLTMLIEEENVPHEENDLHMIKTNAEKAILDWKNQFNRSKEETEKLKRKIEDALGKLKHIIEEKQWESKLKNAILKSLHNMPIRHYQHINKTVADMKQFSISSLEGLDKDKQRAQQAQDYWASRAAMKVLALSNAIRSMISKMKFTNDLGNFPLVQLKEDILPKRTEDVENILKSHFVSSIEKITQKYDNFQEGDDQLTKEIKSLVGDDQILFASLRHQYPTLMVYNMKTENAFTYGRPKKEYYSTWKTINKGDEKESDGSGGQKLSARMIIMMMLLSIKNDSDRNWTPLLLDNPFGQAASEHVLDPIFAVAEKLKFQLMIVTPPQLVKTEISSRFPVYYKLDFKKERGKEIISETIQYSFRKHLT